MRCNIIDPTRLTDQHLIAERRELRMIPPLLSKRIKSHGLVTHDIPKQYCLGSGHQKFWLDKFLYLEKRYISLTDEMINRKFKPNLDYFLDTRLAKEYGMYNDWEPKSYDIEIIKFRLIEKIKQKMSWYKYLSKPITQEWLTWSLIEL